MRHTPSPADQRNARHDGCVTPRARHPNHRSRDSLPVELRRVTVPKAARAWVAAETGSTVDRAGRLPGASTTAVHRLDLSSGRSVVLKRYVWRWVLEDEPVAPQREVDALLFAGRHELAVPAVLAADVTGETVGDGVPAILMTFLPGRAVGVPDLDRLAEVAAAVHDVEPDGLAHDYFPWCRETTTGPPPSATRPELWDAAIDRWLNHTPAYRPTFIHRDFHPGNVLWAGRQSTGIVDWANACRGPWGCDVAHCRAMLVQLAGPESADRFLDTYQSRTGRTFDPYWEIASVLEHGPSHWNAVTVAESERRLERALRAPLTSGP